jgi:hypothetical protein
LSRRWPATAAAPREDEPPKLKEAAMAKRATGSSGTERLQRAWYGADESDTDYVGVSIKLGVRGVWCWPSA